MDGLQVIEVFRDRLIAKRIEAMEELVTTVIAGGPDVLVRAGAKAGRVKAFEEAHEIMRDAFRSVTGEENE